MAFAALAAISLLSCKAQKPDTRHIVLWDPLDSLGPPRHHLEGAAWCLRYEPDTVDVTGTLRRLTFPGLPNYESVAEGDEAETGLYLLLGQPICTMGDTLSTDEYPVQSADTVQLVLDSVGYAHLRPSLGQRLTLSGTLFARFTGHHHAPLLLQVLKE